MRINIAQSSPPSLLHTLHPHYTLQTSLRIHRTPCTKSMPTNHFKVSCNTNINAFNGHDVPIFPTPKTTHVDLLEPSFLGIRPNPPDWPARDEVLRETVARRANSIDIPLSLRMIAMKQKLLKLESEKMENSPMNNLCSSTLCIIREVQRCALKSRVVDDGVVSKVQRDMMMSFVWLFKEVFAKTPDFMLHVMVLTSNFASLSLESLDVLGETEGGEVGCDKGGNLEENEVVLWNYVVDEADLIRGDKVKDLGLGFVVDHEDYGGVNDGVSEKFKFVSPMKVEIEKDDDYEEYHKTDMMYQIGLFQDPNNTLLLSNYGQFLCLVSRDYDRAEECFKRAIQLDRSDAEIVSLYANFLWVVRKDLWGAEERFQQAIAAEPDNSYHASKYASFLWSTGGDETCYPIDPPRSKS